ncbi:acetolactate decarboxylase, partial [bacterium]|nr:acetolactate decarboxylase [bacterium]
PSLNRFYAIQVHGTFSFIKTRSVPRQTEPYPPLAEVAKTQPEFEYEQTTGTLAGFRCPAFVKGINVPGYHLHFLSDDHQTGGHVLAFTLAHGTVQLDETTDFQLRLPEGAAFEQTDLTNDQTAALEKVEK